MVGALLFLRAASLWNLLRRRVLRLRRPQYLAGALVAAAYFYFIFVHEMGEHGPGRSGDIRAMAFVSAGATLGLLFGLQLLWTWLGPVNRAGLLFSEAEVAFLFPAPVSRRALIHYNLLSTQLSVVLTALFFTLFSGRWLSFSANPFLRFAGWWVVLTVLRLHQTAAALTIVRLAERGVSSLLRRILVLGVCALFAAGCAVSLWRHGRWPVAADFATPTAFFDYVHVLLEAGWMPLLLLPFKAALGPLAASGGREFARALGPALLLLAAHYLWAVSLRPGFEEGSIALAQRRGRLRAEWQSGGSPWSRAPRRGQREPFLLKDSGRPELAFLWKNLLSIRSSLSWRFLLIPLCLAGGAGLGGRGHALHAPFVVAIAGIVAVYTLLAGHQYARQDLRGDLANADLLKAYPLAGWQVVLGEMLAPAAILTAILWLALLAAALALEPYGRRIIMPAAAGLAAVTPVLCLLQLFMPNAAMLLFPAWHQATPVRGGGIEAIGQRLIFVFGQLLILLLALLPAALAAFVLIFASSWILGPPVAIFLATLAVLAILGTELVVGLWWLGRRFERFDLSTELKA